MAGAVELGLRVSPRASRSGIDGVDGEGCLRVRVTAPPVDGAANEAIVALLASELGVRRSAVVILTGLAGRRKRVRIEDAEATDLLARWPDLRLERRPGT